MGSNTVSIIIRCSSFYLHYQHLTQELIKTDLVSNSQLSFDLAYDHTARYCCFTVSFFKLWVSLQKMSTSQHDNQWSRNQVWKRNNMKIPVLHPSNTIQISQASDVLWRRRRIHSRTICAIATLLSIWCCGYIYIYICRHYAFKNTPTLASFYVYNLLDCITIKFFLITVLILLLLCTLISNQVWWITIFL